MPIFLQAGNPEFTQQLLAEGRAVPDVVGLPIAVIGFTLLPFAQTALAIAAFIPVSYTHLDVYKRQPDSVIL